MCNSFTKYDSWKISIYFAIESNACWIPSKPLKNSSNSLWENSTVTFDDAACTCLQIISQSWPLLTTEGNTTTSQAITHLVVYIGNLHLEQSNGLLAHSFAHVRSAQMKLPMRVLQHQGPAQCLLPQLAKDVSAVLAPRLGKSSGLHFHCRLSSGLGATGVMHLEE